MPDRVNQTLVKVLETVLEQFAFAFCELVDKSELETDEDEFVQSSLSFTGPCNGEMSIIMPAELCAEIAGNVLGLDEDSGDVLEYAQDTLKELLNVYVGNILTELYGEDALFDFATPSLKRLNLDEWNELVKDSHAIGVLIEDTPAILRFCVA